MVITKANFFKQRWWKYFFICGLVVGLFFTVFTLPAHAEDSWWTGIVQGLLEDVLGIATLNENEVTQAKALLNNDYIKFAEFPTPVFYTIGGWVVKVLLLLAGYLEDLIPQTFSLFGLLEDTGLNDFTASMIKGFGLALVVLMITWYGVRTIIMNKPPKYKSILINIIVMVGLLAGLNELMASMQDMATSFFNDAVESGTDSDTSGLSHAEVQAQEALAEENTGLAWGLVKHNIADVVYLTQNGFDAIDADSDKNKNGLTKQTFLSANMGDVLKADMLEELVDTESSVSETKFLLWRLGNDGSEQTLEPVDSGGLFSIFTDSFEGGYIRYPMKFFTIFCSLLSLCVAYIFTIFVFVSTIIEIGMKKVVAPLIFISDLETGQKTKAVLQDLFNGFLTIAFTGLSLRFYSIVVNYLADADLNPILYVVAMICTTIGLIRGSQSITKYFGVDVGLKDGKNSIMGAIGAMAAVNGVRKGVTGAGKTAFNSLKGGLQQSQHNNPKRSNGTGVNQDGVEAPGENLASNGVATNESGMKNILKNAGATFGYAGNRGIGGMAVDAKNKVMDTAADKTSNVTQGLKNNVDDTLGAFQSGKEGGKEKAMQNKERVAMDKLGKSLLHNISEGDEQLLDPGVNSGGKGNQDPLDIRSNSQSGMVDSDNQNLMTDAQQIQGKASVKENMKSNGTISNAELNSQYEPSQDMQIDRDISMVMDKDKTLGEAGTDSKTDAQRIQGKASVQDKMSLSGSSFNPLGTQSMDYTQDIILGEQKEGMFGQAGVDRKTDTQTIQQQASVKGNVHNNGATTGFENQNPLQSNGSLQQDMNINNITKASELPGRIFPEDNIEAMTVTRENMMKSDVKTDGPSVSKSFGGIANGAAAVSSVNINDRIKNEPLVGGNTSIHAQAETLDREVGVQSNANSTAQTGGTIPVGHVQGETLQGEVNVRDTLRSQGKGVGSAPRSHMQRETAQREVNVNDTFSGGGQAAGSAPRSHVQRETAQREVNVNDTFSGGGQAAGSAPRSHVQRETAQREVNVNDTFSGGGQAAGSAPRSHVQRETVQREVNVNDTFSGGGQAAGSAPRSHVQRETVEREIEVENHVKKGGSPFRQRGSTVNRTGNKLKREVHIQEQEDSGVAQRHGKGLK